jgi:hypothetical protein
MGCRECIPAGGECFPDFGFNFQLAEGLWLVAPGAKRDGLAFSDTETARNAAGWIRFLNNAGGGFRFHVRFRTGRSPGWIRRMSYGFTVARPPSKGKLREDGARRVLLRARLLRYYPFSVSSPLEVE